MSGPFILVPFTITDAMLTSSTAVEPAATETAWNAATSYTVGQECVRTGTHRVYTNLIAGVNATPPESATGGSNPRWYDTRPTNKWAAWDGQVDTQSVLVTPLTYVMRPGLYNAIAAYGLDGAQLDLSIKDSPAGAVVDTRTTDLLDPPLDYWDYYFGHIRTLSKVLWSGLTPYADPEVTITISAAGGTTVKAGMIAFGDLRSLIEIGARGGTRYGAKAKPVTSSYIGKDPYGNFKIVRRNSATDLEISVLVPQADADSALATMQQVLDMPAAFIGSDVAGYAGLNVFGLASGALAYPGPDHAELQISVQGFKWPAT